MCKFSLPFFFLIIFNCKSCSFPIDAVMKQFILRSNPYQITVLRSTNGSIFDKKHTFFAKLAETQIPVTLVNFNKSNLTSLAAPRSTTYIILYSSKEYKNINHLLQQDLDTIIQKSVWRTRPRCLLLFPNTNPGTEVFLKILIHAWSLKFLDFSIVSGNSLFHYNPFTSTFTIKQLSPKFTLFPDKMSNMHGYKLMLPFIDSSPYIMRHNNVYVGSEYRIIQATAEVLNFKPTVIDYGSGYGALKKAVRDLEAGSVNILPFSLFTTHPLTLRKPDLVLGKVFLFDSFKGVVSSSLTMKTRFDPSLQLLKTLIFLFSGVLLVLLVVYLVNFLKIARKQFKVFTTVQLLLGEPGVKLPKAGVDRILYISIVLLSMTYFNDLFSEMTEYELMDSPIPLVTFEDLVNSKLTPHVNVGIYNWVFKSSEESLQALQIKTQRSSSNDCVR